MKKVDAYLEKLPAWQAKNLQTFRRLVHERDDTVTEDFKWNVPVFVLNGKMIFAVSAFKAHTKFNFIQNGALLEDTDKLFNNGFDSKTSRGIDLKEGESVPEDKLVTLIDSSLALAKH